MIFRHVTRPTAAALSASFLAALFLVVAPVAMASENPAARPRVLSIQLAKPLPPAAGMAVPSPTGAEIVGKLLAPKASDPNVPLPHPDLAEEASTASPPLQGPKLFGRGEQGGGVLGFRVPIPADRNAPRKNTTSGVGNAAGGGPFEAFQSGR